jgi:nucleoside-diphosphate-sugar epimerase
LNDSCFTDASVLVVGGAGFVGGALVRRLVDARPRRVAVVDNLLSADLGNVPEHPAVDFIFGSIADDRIWRRCRATLITYFTWRAITAINPRSTTRSPITRTTR